MNRYMTYWLPYDEYFVVILTSKTNTHFFKHSGVVYWVKYRGKDDPLLFHCQKINSISQPERYRSIIIAQS
jgi:hypothetical protein